MQQQADLRAGSVRAPFIWARQGEVSMTMGILPPSEALTRDCSSCWPMWEAAPLKPLLLNIIPQQLLLSPCTCRAAVRGHLSCR